jgi:UDP-2-acetamido-2-deoxy-ribo-hexuluronate aminotransferase
MDIQMVDLKTQYQNIKKEMDQAIAEVLQEAIFINGPHVKTFATALASYLDVKHVIPCANGTDALQIAMMALDLQPGDEIIVPSFTYVATAEVIALLKLKPVMVDVNYDSFGIDIQTIESVITPRTRAIVPVHLYGQGTYMDQILDIASRYHLYVIEDNAQAIGGDFTLSDGTTKKLGTIGHIGTTSFFPSKNLGCYGDGGAIMTNDDQLAKKMSQIANHGQSVKYVHESIGCNSRLDTLQAAILSVKLQYLDRYCTARQEVATHYDQAFAHLQEIEIPYRVPQSTHVFHQYTLKIKNGKRDTLKSYLQDLGIPSMIYYPIPLYKQQAFKSFVDAEMHHPITERLCSEVLSLPIHTEMDPLIQSYIIDKVLAFYD